MDQLNELFSANDFVGALKLCSNMEMRIEEQSAFLPQNQLEYFYNSYLISFLIVGDLNGAKYLWKRAPNGVKREDLKQYMPAIWRVGKYLWQENYNAAFQSLKVEWPADIKSLIANLHNSMVTARLQTFSSAYSVVKVEVVAESLAISKQEAVQIVSSIGWRVDGPAELVYPTARSNNETLVETVDKLSANIRMMEKVTQYAAHLDRSALKVDLSGKSDPKSGSTKVR